MNELQEDDDARGATERTDLRDIVPTAEDESASQAPPDSATRSAQAAEATRREQLTNDALSQVNDMRPFWFNATMVLIVVVVLAGLAFLIWAGTKNTHITTGEIAAWLGTLSVLGLIARALITPKIPS